MSLGLNILLIFIFLLLGSVFAGTELAASASHKSHAIRTRFCRLCRSA